MQFMGKHRLMSMINFHDTVITTGTVTQFKHEVSKIEYDLLYKYHNI